ncbi:filamentous haemagglutinin family protein [Aliidongia dinghuensis]|nr:filamentous haemagglutinin family protein [Aliidongia dinghuensis]
MTLLGTQTPARARNILSAGPAAPATAAAIDAAAANASATAMAQQSMNALSRATQALQAVQAAQSAARNLALSASATVPDGLTPGGLVPYPGATTDAALQAQGIVWQNAQLPTQVTAPNGTVDVTVRQTAPKALLTWQSFNIGKNTTLDFDQQGNSQWTVLNRVLAGPPDPVTGARVQAAPSQILGKINAPGQVYVINQNGIIFGGSAQVNVHALIASSLDIGLPTSNLGERNAYFNNANNSELTFSAQYLIDRSASGIDGVKVAQSAPGTAALTPTFTLLSDAMEGDVTVAPGAVIATPALSSSNESLGSVVLAGPNVTNQGSILVPDGQAILVAARHFTLDSNSQALLTQNGVDPSRYDPNLRGSIVRTGLDDLPADKFLFGNNSPNLTLSGISVAHNDMVVLAAGDPFAWAGRVTSSGVISADRGNITLVGQAVSVDGVLSLTTSVNQNGSIDILATPSWSYQSLVGGDGFVYYFPVADAGAITLGANATVEILADTTVQADGTLKTLPSDATSSAQFRNSVITMKAEDGSVQTTPASLVIGTGTLQAFKTPGQITIDGGALVKAPSASLTLSAGDPIADNTTNTSSTYQRPATVTAGLVIEAGATLDVSGLMDVELPMSSNLITVSRVGLNELADDPLQRNSFLYRQPVVLDRRLHGTRADGSTWEGSPLLNANGYVDAYGRTVGELLQPGGSIQLNGAAVVSSGSVLNISGGYVHYQAGNLATTRVLGADGHIYDIGTANLSVPIVGFAGRMTVDHAHWGVSETYVSALINGGPGLYQAAYDQGANAGALTVTGPSIVEGTILAGVTVGVFQHAGVGPYSSSEPQGGTFNLSPSAAPTTPPDERFWPTLDLTIAKTAPEVLPAAFAPGDALATSQFDHVTLSSDALNASGLATLNLVAADNITVAPDAALALPNGGKLSLSAQIVAIGGTITAHSGSIAISLAPDAPNYFAGLTPTAQPPRVGFTLDAGAVLDVSGLWVNDAGATNALGTSDVNGGTVSIADQPANLQNPNADFVPDVASVTLAQGSLIDLTGGGHVATNGTLSVDSTGVPLGRGGNLSIVLHGTQQGSPGQLPSTPDTAGLPAPQRRGFLDDSIAIGATIRDAGFQGGGSFTLTAPSIRVGTGTLGGTGGDITVPIGFLENAGFGSYSLTGDFTATVDSGSVIDLTQKQLIPNANAASASSIAAAATLGQRTGDQRRPVNFSLAGLGWTAFDIGETSATGSVALDRALVADGVQILADPGAAISLSAVGQLTFGGRIVAPGGAVSLSEQHLVVRLSDQAAAIELSPEATLFVRPGSVIDVSGAFVADPVGSVVVQGRQIQAGTVQPGGTVTFSATALEVPAGVTVNVSGGTGIVDLLSGTTTGLGGGRYAATTVGSDAGAVTIAAASSLETTGLNDTADANAGYGAFEGTIAAAGGTPTNAGGHVTVSSAAVIVTDGGSVLPADAQPGQMPATVSTGFVLPAQTLVGGGVDWVTLTATNLAGSGTVAFSGSPTLALGRELDIQAANIAWLPSGTVDPAAAIPAGTLNGAVTLSAPYLSIAGVSGLNSASALAAPSAVTLNIAAGTIDLAGFTATQGFTTVDLASTGDIRFVPQGTTNLAGLIVGGDVTLAAAQIYPATGVTGLVRSTGATGTITVARTGAAAPVPLSAGGTLVLDAATIEQGGVLRAPLGTIILGPAAAYVSTLGTDVAANKIDLLPDSVTSTSLDGGVVPYGHTVAQTDWYYYGSNGGIAPSGGNASVPITSLPEQQVYINGTRITEAAGATLDLSGGGDVVAPEFVPGLGGSQNVLRTSLTGNANATVYAILPGAQPNVAPVDLDLTGGKAEATHGQTITTLGNIPGLPAGTYTLYPGDYANLAGAFRVELRSGTTDFSAGTAVRMPDGGYTVAATTGIAGTAIQSSRTQAYSIMSGTAWRQYSQINSTSGNSYFANLAATANIVAPRLPVDAGHLTLGATTGLVLQGTNLFQAGAGGRGGEADITGAQIEVASAGVAPQAGYLVLDPADLRDLNVDSLLLGGTRTSTTAGEQLTATATSMLVDTTAADPLTNPELILVTGTVGGTAGQLTIAPGSVVEALGTASAVTTPIVAGTTSFLRLSNAGLVTVTRQAAAPTQDLIAIGAGAVLDGGASLLMSAAGDATIDNSAEIGATAIDLGASHINIGAPAGVTGTDIGPATLAQLAQAKVVILRGTQAITFYQGLSIGNGSGAFTFDTPVLAADPAAAGTVQISGNTVTFTNDLGASPSVAPTAGSVALAVNANQIGIGGTDKVINGFGSVALTAGTEILVGTGGTTKGGLQTVPTGSLTTTADLLLSTPQLVLANASKQSIATSGQFKLVGLAGAGATGTDQLGGRLDVDAGSIDIEGTIFARAGAVNLRARTGDLTLGSTAKILAGGYEQNFVATVVDVGAGAVTLAADQGNITLAGGGLIDLAGVGRGDGGSLSVTLGSAASTLSLAGTVTAAGGNAGAGSSAFTLNSQGTVALDDVARLVATAGFKNRIAVTSGSGDLALSVGMTAQEVDLDAEGGRVTVSGTIDSSGTRGGHIALYGADGVTLTSTAQLLARASNATAHAGLVEIGTSGSGQLDLEAGSMIDVTGGAGIYGLSGGGTIHFRAPFASFGSNILQSTLVGPTAVIFEPFKTVDVSQINGAVINQSTWAGVPGDPNNPGIIGGFMSDTDTTGIEAQVAALYPQLAALGVLHVQPGLELDNFDKNANNGGITFQDLNQVDPIAGAPTPLAIDFSALRFGAAHNEPGWLTVRAVGDITLDATFSDGFQPDPGSGLATDAGAPLMTWSGSGPLPLSWSYRFTSGAAVASANPTATAAAGQGNLLIGDTNALSLSFGNPSVLIRTGTGSIDLAAGGSISLLNVYAEVYTAGVNTPNPAGFSNGSEYNAISTYGLFGAGSDPTLAIPTGSGDITIKARGDFNQPGVVQTAPGLTGYYLAWSSYAANTANNVPWLGFDGSSTSNPSVDGLFGSDPSSFGSATSQSAEFVDFAALGNAGNLYTFGGPVAPATGAGIAAIGGGSISLSAGGNVNDAFLYVVSPFRVTGGLSAGAPTVMTRYGSGNLTVAAGGNIAGGVAYVDNGLARISAGDAVTSTATPQGIQASGLAATGLAIGLGDASALVTARNGIDIAQVFQAAQGINGIGGGALPNVGALTQMSLYGLNDQLTMVTAAGDLTSEFGSYAPPTVDLVSPRGTIQLTGNWTLAPSPTGTLDLLASDAVQFEGTVQMLDINPDLLGTPLHPSSRALFDEVQPQLYHFANLLTQGVGDGTYPTAPVDGANNYLLHDGPVPLHAGDTTPAYIVALNGDIAVGAGNPNDPVQIANLNGLGEAFNPSNKVNSLILPKAAVIWAGRSIYGLTYSGQNVSPLDTTLIRAGQDISYTPGALYQLFSFSTPSIAGAAATSFTIGGPGQFDLIAGRSINLSPSSSSGPEGVQAVGNLINPWLPKASAQINLLYGVGPGLDQTAFANRYLDPALGVGQPGGYAAAALVAYMDTRAAELAAEGGTAGSTDLTPAEAYTAFLALSPADQLPLIEQVFFAELRSIAPDPNSAVISNPARAFAAIDTLFPPADGYTDQSAAAPQRQTTGNLRMLNSVVRTEFGSSINILGPGGNALLGSLTLDPTLPPNYQGIFTARGGSINVFLDGNFTVNNSRVFTEQGGDETIYSANGNIDAGRGKKTASFNPPLTVLYDGGLVASINPSGTVTGSGIGTLVTVPGSPRGNIYLLAPHGDVDAGDAGIHASGNVTVLALQVLNADNIQAAGTTVGLPTTVAPNTGLLAAASNTAGAAVAAAEETAQRTRQPAVNTELPSIITVEVIGYGGASPQDKNPAPADRRRQSSDARPTAPDPRDAVQVVGVGELSRDQMRDRVQALADQRRRSGAQSSSGEGARGPD